MKIQQNKIIMKGKKASNNTLVEKTIHQLKIRYQLININ